MNRPHGELTDYYPFGDQRINDSTSFSDHKKYTDHFYDTDTDLTYMKARYYTDEGRRFLAQDPVFVNLGVDPRSPQVLENPQLQNAYSYVGNNPLVYNDPEGEFLHIVAGALIGGGVGLVGQAVADIVSGELSGFSSYAGSFAGGAVAGGVIVGTGGVGLLAGAGAAVLGGATESAVTQGLNVLSGDQESLSIANIAVSGAIDGAISFIPFSKTLKEFVPGADKLMRQSSQMFQGLKDGVIDDFGSEGWKRVWGAGFLEGIGGESLRGALEGVSNRQDNENEDAN